MKTEDQFLKIANEPLPLKRYTCRLWEGQIDKVENRDGQFVDYIELEHWLKNNFK